MYYKEIVSAVAIAITFIAFFPYIRSIFRGATRPHVFSWIIWGSTTFVVFLAQLQDEAGVGAWPIGVSGIITIFIALLAYIKRADISITKVDWLIFTAAMTSLPAWYVTSDPLWAVVILTTVDTLGFGPTIRKIFSQPHSESLLFFGLFAARNLIVVLALENYTLTTILFPAVIALACLATILLMLYRRRVLGSLAANRLK
ncbi:MAG: hypothetical protein JSV38_00750 [Desulfobacterales bacterium]|nr:MAG: hypothetical protein JSV38_00750 [Desulfobacterales bacterium]